MRSDGLHMRNMNVSHGRSAEMMHATIIHEVGPHPRILHVGDNQEMHFVEGDNGPFWMTLAKQAETKHDRHLGIAKTRNKTKIELLKDLWQSGHDTTKQRYLKADLLALCGQRNILVTVKECQVNEGWLGSQKGCCRYFGSVAGLTRPKLSVVEACVTQKMEKKKTLVRNGK
jgi:hypothetical protein